MVNENKIEDKLIDVSGAAPDLSREAYVDLVLHVGDDNYYIDTVVSVDIQRDYNMNYSDYTSVTFIMPLGDFVKKVYPNRDDLEVTLSITTVGAREDTVFIFKLTKFDNLVRSGTYASRSMNDLNKDNTMITGQCINKTVKGLRNKITHGIYRDVTVEDVIKAIALKHMNKFSALYGAINNGFELVPPNNTRKYDHIIVPNNTAVIDIAKVLQKELGVYNGEVCTYLQTYNNTEKLFITPKYRYDLLGFMDRKLVITGLGSSTIRSLDSTYAMDGDDVNILVEKSNKLNDNDDYVHDKGTAIETVNSDSLNARPIQLTSDGMKVSESYVRDRLAHKELNDGIGKVEFKGVTNNQYDARSEVLKRDGSLIQLVWSYSNARLLTPMMPVIYVHEESDTIIKYEGILQRVDISIDNKSRIETALLTVFMKKSDGILNIKDKIRIK